ncbi:ABC transporter ATP-binding protein, partial [Mycobacterium sp. ITM-2017-0098]
MTWSLLRPRLPRVAVAVIFGALSLGSALGLTAVSAWLITRAWEMPPVLHLTVAAVTVRALGISRGVLGYCERLASHDTALRAAGTAREQLFTRLATGPADGVM